MNKRIPANVPQRTSLLPDYSNPDILSQGLGSTAIPAPIQSKFVIEDTGWFINLDGLLLYGLVSPDFLVTTPDNSEFVYDV